MSIEQKILAAGIELPSPAAPFANYVPFVREGNLVFIAGQGPIGLDGRIAYVGRVGSDLSEEDGYRSARCCGLNCLAQIRAALGTLDALKRVVSLRGFVNSAEDFFNQAQVVNGASDLMVEVFGEAGRHARAAIGTSVLPMNIATEVELIVVARG